MDLRVTSVKPYNRDEKEELPEVIDLADSSLSSKPPFDKPGLGNTIPQSFPEPVLGRTNPRVTVKIPVP